MATVMKPAAVLLDFRPRVICVLVALAGLTGGAVTPWLSDGRPVRRGAAWYEDDPVPEFRTMFAASDKVSVRIRIACAGYYSLCLNGKPVDVLSKTSLMPLWSPYDKTLYEDTIDIPPRLLNEHAPNDLRVRLGKGWYDFPPLAFWGGLVLADHMAHGRSCFRLEIEGMGPLSWTWRETSIIQNCIHLGTHEDRTRPEDSSWKTPVVVAGPSGRILPRRAPPVDVIATRVGKVCRLGAGGVQVVDFGVNTAGVPRFLFSGTKCGERIEIVYGERLNQDGSVNAMTQVAGQIKRHRCISGGDGAPETAAQRDVLICGGGESEAFSPSFTWHACRYAEIRGARNKVLRAELDEVSSVLGDVEPGKSFQSECEDFTRLHQVCRRTFRSNLIGVQSDCPGRERLGYGGDIVATCEAMMLNWDMREFYLKTLQDFADEAEAGDGWIPETAPYVGIRDGFWGGRAGPISWALAVPVLMDALIRHYPDVADRVLSFYPVCMRYVHLVDSRCPDGIVPKDLGDYEALEGASKDAVATAHWFRFVRLSESFARLLGRGADVDELGKIARKISAAFAEKYVCRGYVDNGTQSAQALGLYLGLVPPDQVRAAEAVLEQCVWETDYAPTTGIFATRYMLLYLSEHGRHDLAEKIVRHRGFPGFMNMLDHGATTLWEAWKENADTRSNNHPMFGSVDEWILKYANSQGGK